MNNKAEKQEWREIATSQVMSMKTSIYALYIIGPLVVGGALGYLLNFVFDLTNEFGRSDSYVFYYTYSTIAQGFVALVAFVGALAIFKMQRDQDAKQRLGDQMFPFIHRIMGNSVIGTLLDELIIICKTIAEEPAGHPDRQKIKEIYDKIVPLVESQRLMTIYLKRFAYVCLADVAIALLGIPLIPYVNTNVFGPILLGGTIALSLWVLNLVRPIIQRVLWLTP